MSDPENRPPPDTSQRASQSAKQREQDFLRRRRVVLFGFALFTLLFAALAAIFHRAVGRGVVWLFSESYVAVIALSVIMAIWAAKAQRARTLNAMRPQERAEAARSVSPPGVMLLKLFVILAGLALVGICAHRAGL